ncbi:MAG: hypothetical protein HXX12_16445 [Geothrix sp.]|uniref:hypothetical protein n=1 Tax=Geothrix sp. TaxID=1962974 RepID=UPI0018135FAE|nr:hypothetical protein [Geothrix sp.]NWJ42553.1 hypothetical protein [Geothrix sp.]WIL19486.1 MAG: hypothetical protein QOZ81_002005 [Geothrix sp.]
MSSAVLAGFFLSLVIMFVFAIRFPALAIPLGIMTYAYKQIASLAVPTFQTRGPLFNYMMAAMIAVIYLYNIIVRNPGVNCWTKSGKTLQVLTWAFLGFFWISIMWSPYYGADSWRFLPYFLVYFAMLPSLTESPELMLRAYIAVWALTLLATLGLMVSPAFHLSPDIGRLVVHFQVGQYDEGNPLAIADMGAYLIILSTCILLMQTTQRENRGLPKTLWLLAGATGLVMGLWLTFNTSRGETFTGIACACVLVSLVKGRDLAQYAKWMVYQVAFLAALSAIVFFSILPKNKIAELSWRYSASSMAEASNDRMGLSAKTIEMALSSPRNLLVGIGARGCEKRLGIYPHNHFVQAFGETGIIGFGMLCLACLLAFRFGFRTLALARQQAQQPTVIFAALMLSLFIYQLIVLSKKGSLTFVDTVMWLGIATFGFDRAQFMLERARDAQTSPALDGSERG